MNWRQKINRRLMVVPTANVFDAIVQTALIGPDGEVRLTAFNGPPMGVLDTAARRERPTKYLFSAHAEANLISFAAREGIRTKGCTVYCTHSPCAACARTLIQAGIHCIVVGAGTTSMPESEFKAAAEMLRESSVCLALYSHGTIDF